MYKNTIKTLSIRSINHKISGTIDAHVDSHIDCTIKENCEYARLHKTNFKII